MGLARISAVPPTHPAVQEASVADAIGALAAAATNARLPLAGARPKARRADTDRGRRSCAAFFELFHATYAKVKRVMTAGGKQANGDRISEYATLGEGPSPPPLPIPLDFRSACGRAHLRVWQS